MSWNPFKPVGQWIGSKLRPDPQVSQDNMLNRAYGNWYEKPEHPGKWQGIDRDAISSQYGPKPVDYSDKKIDIEVNPFKWGGNEVMDEEGYGGQTLPKFYDKPEHPGFPEIGGEDELYDEDISLRGDQPLGDFNIQDIVKKIETGGAKNWGDLLPDDITAGDKIGQTYLTEDEMYQDTLAGPEDLRGPQMGALEEQILDTSEFGAGSPLNRPFGPQEKPKFMSQFGSGEGALSGFNLGNIGSAKFGDAGELTDPGKGLFGKEGGFMSKFGTGGGVLSGLLGGLGKGLGKAGENMLKSQSYMYKNPYE